MTLEEIDAEIERLQQMKQGFVNAVEEETTSTTPELNDDTELPLPPDGANDNAKPSNGEPDADEFRDIAEGSESVERKTPENTNEYGTDNIEDDATVMLNVEQMAIPQYDDTAEDIRLIKTMLAPIENELKAQNERIKIIELMQIQEVENLANPIISEIDEVKKEIVKEILEGF